MSLPALPKIPPTATVPRPLPLRAINLNFACSVPPRRLQGPTSCSIPLWRKNCPEFADRLERAEDFSEDLHHLIKEVIRQHKRIIFNGNNYSREWVEEAARRGLCNLKTTVDCLPAYLAPKNIDLFLRHKVFTESEIRSRYDIIAENYCKTLLIEARTMRDMARRDIIPAVCRYMDDIARTAMDKRAVSQSLPCTTEQRLLEHLSGLCDQLYERLEWLDKAIDQADAFEGDLLERARYCHDGLLAEMERIRSLVDGLETSTGSGYWPYPTYAQLLYSV